MAVVSLNKKELKNLIGNLSDEKIDEILSLFGTAVEKITNEEVDIEVAPNRPDMLSEHGVLRALSTFFGGKTREYKVHKPEKEFEVKIDSSVNEVRPFTACAIVKNLKFDDNKIKEIIDIQEKIHNTLGRNRKKVAIGIYPLEKIKLPVKYEARNPQDIKFVPLESGREMDGLQILSQHSAGREYGHLLEGKKKFPVFVDAMGEILSMPPIINSHKTGKITEETKEVFIECSGFDFNILQKTLNILVTMLADIGGGIYSMNLKYKNKPVITPDLKPEKFKINLENVNKLLGLELKENDVKKLLGKMGYGYNKLVAEVPAYRTDILHEVDIAEDIAIAYGYKNFSPEIPEISSIGEEDRKQVLARKISETLAGLGFLEVSTYHLVNEDMLKKAGKSEKLDKIKVKDSKTDFTILRPDLSVSLFKILAENVDSEYPQKICEIGKVFKKNEKCETGIEEKTQLACFSVPCNFTQIKQILEYLGRMLNLQFSLKEAEHPYYISGRTGKIVLGDKEIGTIGEIHPRIIKNLHIKMPLAGFELCVDELG
ncbi:phenylalanine--tRNA ligase subunit beta [Candidatus Woesearchaeota archaeon CG10_big_fil_rev_8_21_14_0_10_34_12]|nr:MAG: phenylalanine--tRNA ligase subunit beta [Candidatus Woesearchaeota archaeon CG10_big_fil_rev_8_21_14_0_10_34_12]